MVGLASEAERRVCTSARHTVHLGRVYTCVGKWGVRPVQREREGKGCSMMLRVEGMDVLIGGERGEIKERRKRGGADEARGE